MKRTQRGDKNAQAERFAQTHRRRVGTNYTDEWAENLSEKLKFEWKESHNSSNKESSSHNKPPQTPYRKKK